MNAELGGNDFGINDMVFPCILFFQFVNYVFCLFFLTAARARFRFAIRMCAEDRYG